MQVSDEEKCKKVKFFRRVTRYFLSSDSTMFAVGFMISCYFGYWGIMYLGLNAIESNIVIITISMLVYHNYKKGAVASF